MGRIYLGEFEELILLTIGVLGDDAYAVAITKEIEVQAGRSVNVSAVHKSVYRLEEKGMLKSRLSEPESKRGGKSKRIFSLSAYGKKALTESMELRIGLARQIPHIALKY